MLVGYNHKARNCHSGPEQLRSANIIWKLCREYSRVFSSDTCGQRAYVNPCGSWTMSVMLCQTLGYVLVMLRDGVSWSEGLLAEIWV